MVLPENAQMGFIDAVSPVESFQMQERGPWLSLCLPSVLLDAEVSLESWRKLGYWLKLLK